MAELPEKGEGDLSVTALYTSQTWIWGEFPYAGLFASRGAERVFNATNAVMRFFAWFRRSPSLQHSLIQRHTMIDHLAGASGCTQFVELAAGLSRRGATLSEDPGVAYVEVDLPAMVATKARLLEASEEGRVVAARSNLRRLAGDAREMDLGALHEDGPVCVVAEGLLMYFDAETQQALWRRIAALCAERPGSALIFDFVPAVEQPKPGFIGALLGGLMRRFTKGRGFVVDERTREQVVEDLREAGFARVDVYEPGQLEEAAVPALDVFTQTLVWRARMDA
ncbi:MAG: class I SAM-dependent methyltransferase [Proteobacteria bacterium]|nr:class I SAM-dependent methyltransferase [Pseudomonadota bacterium]